MVYAIVFALLSVVISAIVLRPKRFTKLKKLPQTFESLNPEIEIFNKMKLKRPESYLKWLGRLYRYSKTRFTGSDPIDKLFYLYACAKLNTRQHYKNFIYTFGFGNHVRNRVFAYSLRGLKLSKRPQLFAIPQPNYAFMQTKIVPKWNFSRFSHSYTITKTDRAEIKNYTYNNIDFYEINGEHRFEHDFNVDKMLCTFSHTSDTFLCSTGNYTTAIFVSGMQRIAFETNLALEKPNLILGINIPKNTPAKVCIFTAKNRAEVLQTTNFLRQNCAQVPYLLNDETKARNSALNALISRANSALYICGEKLKNRLQSICGLLPTFHLPTLVFDITSGEELFAVIDRFDQFKLLASAGMRFNVVIMYSAQNDVVREFISAYTNRREAKTLVSMGVFLFFVDRTTAPIDAIYYLSKMQEASTNQITLSQKNAELPANELQIISRKAVSYSTTDFKTLTTKYHRIAQTLDVLDQFGNPIPIGSDAIVTEIRTAPKQKPLTRRGKNVKVLIPNFFQRGVAQLVSATL